MLGELQVVDGDAEVPIRGAKQRMLLLLLLVRARETVQAERLADELWGDDPPAGGANALQALVSKLRRALGPLSDALTTGAGGYRIDVADEEIDARCFEAAAARGRGGAGRRRCDRGGGRVLAARSRCGAGPPSTDPTTRASSGARRSGSRSSGGVRSRIASTPTCGADATWSWWASWSSWSGRRRCASGSTAS